MNDRAHPRIAAATWSLVARLSDRSEKTVALGDTDVLVGTGKDCQIQIKDMWAAAVQVRFSLRSEVVQMQAMDAGKKVWLNRKGVEPGKTYHLQPGNVIQIGDNAIELKAPPSVVLSFGRPAPADEKHDDIVAVPQPITQGMYGCSAGRGVLAVFGEDKAYALDKVRLGQLRVALAELQEEIDRRRIDVLGMNADVRRKTIEPLVDTIVAKLSNIDIADRPALAKDVIDEAVGYGPLQALLDDDSVVEIMVNAPDEIFVEREGRMVRHPGAFSCEQAVRNTIDRVANGVGRHIDESSPMLDARLPGGHRVNAIIPPVALDGAKITVRKFPKRRMGMQDLVRAGTLSQEMAMFLHACVQARKSILISGGTGAGKTTLLNVLSNSIPKSERVVTIEDAAELQIALDNLVSLETRPANAEGKGAITARRLLANALRMRPDRIVIGECRGGEALDMLQAMNTGHEGSLTTLHANSPSDALARLETLVLYAEVPLPSQAIREQIRSAIDVVVQVSRLSDGKRRITEIAELTGLEAGRFTSQPLYKFNRSSGEDGGRAFDACGVPSFRSEIAGRQSVFGSTDIEMG